MMKRLYLIAVLFLGACGGTEAAPPLAPPDLPPDDGTPLSFTDVSKITKIYCLPCHASSPYFKTEAAFRASQAQERAGNRSMPPQVSAEAANLSDADRARLVAF